MPKKRFDTIAATFWVNPGYS